MLAHGLWIIGAGLGWRGCVLAGPSYKNHRERYRSGHNGADSKSCGELSVSSTKNLVTMRVLPGSKIE